MERTHVESSALVSVGYDKSHHLLELEFKDGKVYQYAGVPANIYAELMAAESKGHYFNTKIHNVYQSTPVEDK
jgi:hypothetical protein